MIKPRPAATLAASLTAACVTLGALGATAPSTPTAAAAPALAAPGAPIAMLDKGSDSFADTARCLSLIHI